ncbi:hypothetical protein AYI70_g3726 [Smittium culicis]|uniref:Uncharacterized protein n=1 Tax=Smittium culicis TaxID=133412 RepID=A0A1R1XUF7_9FUNG|nr:hypothetical protein AYI70_g5472 [Smittium culicis]OMJ21020.1 hypothetical protein AYI70_g3726 [Smittium culicis]
MLDHLEEEQGPITAHQIVNYLAELRVEKNLNVITIISYKSETMQLVHDKIGINEISLFKTFIKTLNQTSIQTVKQNKFDISPILDHFKTLSSFGSLSIKYLTSKTCCLIAVCRLMSSNNLHRIDEDRTEKYDDRVTFVIIAPKEKRNGRR